MHISIDDVSDNNVEGFKYKNDDGRDEFVTYSTGGTVSFKDSENRIAYAYIEDIPKLIKALQAAYDHEKKGC